MSTQIDSRPNLDALLARVAAGERSAFEALYTATSGLLFAVCLRLLPDRGEAEEALQDSFLAIWNKAAQFDPARSTPVVWLSAIARHRAIDRLRSQSGAGAALPIEAADTISDDSPTPIDAAHAAGEAGRLDDCLRQLDDRRRSLIRTAFFDAVTYEELARRAQAPLGSIKTLIRRGMLQLRECLRA